MIKLASSDWSFNNIDTVLFDKDGTFIDLHTFWGEMTKLRIKTVIDFYNLPIEFYTELCLFLGFDINKNKMLSNGITALYSRTKIIELFHKKLYGIGIKTSQEKIAEIFDNVSLEFYKNIQNHTKPIDDAIDFIKKLRKTGVKIGIVTSDSVESTKLTIELFGWHNLFDVVIGRESCNKTKESGALTELALNTLESDPNRTILIGDAPMDYISAKNAGINNIILVATGQIEIEELKKTTPYVLQSLSELECLMI